VIKKCTLGILAIAIVAMFAPDANAGCIGNPRFCASYITGSVICQGLKNGLGKKKFCLTETDCGEVICALGGIVDATTGEPSSACNTSGCFPSPDDNCAIPGSAICANNGGGTGGQGQPFNLAGLIFATSSEANCPKPGQCLFETTVADASDVPAEFACKNPNWTVVDIELPTFKAKSCYCSATQFGIDTDSEFDQSTLGDSLCADGTPALCVTELCTVVGTAYTCSPLPATCS
jgi:hypothetical protein